MRQFLRNRHPVRNIGLIHGFGFRQQFRPFGLQLRLYFTRMLIRPRTVAAGVGVDLGPIQRLRAQFQHAHLPGQFQNLDKQRFDFLEEPTPECRYRVVVGVVVRRDDANRHGIVGRRLQLAARNHAGGIAIDQHAQKRRRRIRGRTGTSVEAMGRRRGETPSAVKQPIGSATMPEVDDLSRSIAVFDQARTLLVVVEMSQLSWLVAGMVPGLERRPLKKLDPDPAALVRLIERWRSEAEKAGWPIDRIALAFEAGRDGFWLARWLRERGIEVHVIHSTSVAVTREHRRAKTDRLDTAMLMRVFLGWLRGERGHCRMVAIPTLEEEDAKRPSRERESLVGERTRIINSVKAGLLRLGIRNFNPSLCKAAQ